MADDFKFVQNKKCEYFPCHKGIKEKDFNCLFCYCPLLCLGKNCGGNFKVLSNGVKDCSGCTFPHIRENYDAVIGRFKDIMEIVKLNM